MIGTRGLASLLLLSAVACHRKSSPPASDPPPVAVAADAAPVPDAAPLGRSPGVALIVTLDGHAYLPLEDWLIPADAPDFSEAWGAGPITAVGPDDRSARLKLQAATAAPPAWAAAIGAAVTAYQADGKACSTTIAALYLLGYGTGDALADDEPYLVGQLAPTPGCTPVLATDRAAPAIDAPAPPPTPAERRALEAAFRHLPAYERQAKAGDWGESPAVHVFATAAGKRLAVVANESLTVDDHCSPHGAALRAIFKLDGDVPTLLVQTEVALGGAPVALLDSDHDGNLELVVGPASFDRGMSGTTSLAHYWDAADPDDARDEAPVSDLHFDYYIGCD